MEAHGVSALGVLVLDAETMDCDLVASFPFDLVRPDVLVFEQVHCNYPFDDDGLDVPSASALVVDGYGATDRPEAVVGPGDERLALHHYLEALGYDLVPGFVGDAADDASYVRRGTADALRREGAI